MESNRHVDLTALTRMRVTELRAQYACIFGEATASHNRLWLLRKMAWRMQALAQGGLSERARQRALELANDADIRLGPPRRPSPIPAGRPQPPDGRLLPGAVIQRLYRGARLEVKVLAEGFEYEGTVYRSLSAVAKAITGTHCSGYGFFHLRQREAS